MPIFMLLSLRLLELMLLWMTRMLQTWPINFRDKPEGLVLLYVVFVSSFKEQIH